MPIPYPPSRNEAPQTASPSWRNGQAEAAPADAVGNARLVDTLGRRHRDLRVSLTDRCSLRCRYCMPAEGLDWAPADTLLSTSELLRLIGIATSLGVSAVRLTGGEPLLRPDVSEVIAGIVELPNSPEVSLTTNGLRLPALAEDLAAAGLTRVNISLDTLDAHTFRELTLRDRFADVLEGIHAARAAGLDPVKINAVLLRGMNDHEAPKLLRWALDAGLHLRFIEQMPLDPQHDWDRAVMVTREEILASLATAGYALQPADGRGSAPAEEFLVNGGPATVGIVGSITKPFCGDCDRVRLTADGAWRNCLFARTERDLRTPLRAGAGDAELAGLMFAEVRAKQPGHGVAQPDFEQPDRPMSAIGG